MQRPNNALEEVIVGFPEGYKQCRLLAWGDLSTDWEDHVNSDVFHAAAFDVMVDYIDNIKLPVRQSLIDLGCGPGSFLKKINREHREEWHQLVGIDFCPQMVVKARKTAETVFSDICAYEADVELPLPQPGFSVSGGFQIATAIFLIDEVQNLDACFAFVRAVLDETGLFLCCILDSERDRKRFGRHVEPAARNNQEKPILLSSRPQICDESSPARMFRIFRSSEQIAKSGKASGLELIEETKYSPEDLNLPLNAPSLKLMVFRNQSIPHPAK